MGTSINFTPSGSKCFVSIQLVSPASGDFKNKDLSLCLMEVSIQLVSPASGDADINAETLSSFTPVSIQLVSPASGDLKVHLRIHLQKDVSIQLVSPASGDLHIISDGS